MMVEDPYSETFQRRMITLANRARRWALGEIIRQARVTRRLPSRDEIAAISSRALREVFMPALADLSEHDRMVALGSLVVYALSRNMTDLIDVLQQSTSAGSARARGRGAVSDVAIRFEVCVRDRGDFHQLFNSRSARSNQYVMPISRYI